MIDLMPCAHCGAKPTKGLSKVGHCQMHGDPWQYAIIGCKAEGCPVRPSVQGGDIYCGGKEEAYNKASIIWNKRFYPEDMVPKSLADNLAKALEVMVADYTSRPSSLENKAYVEARAALKEYRK